MCRRDEKCVGRFSRERQRCPIKIFLRFEEQVTLNQALACFRECRNCLRESTFNASFKKAYQERTHARTHARTHYTLHNLIYSTRRLQINFKQMSGETIWYIHVTIMRSVHVNKSILYYKKNRVHYNERLGAPVNNGQVMQTREQFIGYLVQSERWNLQLTLYDVFLFCRAMVEGLIVILIHFLKSSSSVDQTFTNHTHHLKPLYVWWPS